MERKFENPGRIEVRMHALEMSVKSAQLMGRADNALQLAEQYFVWIMSGGDDRKGLEPAPVDTAEREKPPLPAAVRQAMGGKAAAS